MKSHDEIQAHAASLIRRYREGLGMSQFGLAEKLGMHQTAIAKIENMDRKIDFSTMVRIASFLNIPWNELNTTPTSDLHLLKQYTHGYMLNFSTIYEAIDNLAECAVTQLDLGEKLRKRVNATKESELPSNGPSITELRESLDELIPALQRLIALDEVPDALTKLVDPINHLEYALSGAAAPYRRWDERADTTSDDGEGQA